MTTISTWLMVLFGFSLGVLVAVPVAAFLMGLATSASTSDLERERWGVLCVLARLYHAVEQSGGDRSAVDEAMERARAVLEPGAGEYERAERGR